MLAIQLRIAFSSFNGNSNLSNDKELLSGHLAEALNISSNQISLKLYPLHGEIDTKPTVLIDAYYDQGSYPSSKLGEKIATTVAASLVYPIDRVFVSLFQTGD